QICVNPSNSVRVHRCVIGISHDHFMTELLQAPRHPLTLGRSLDQDASPRLLPEDVGEPAPIRRDPTFDQLAIVGQGADLAAPLVHVDPDMIHGSSPLDAASKAGSWTASPPRRPR